MENVQKCLMDRIYPLYQAPRANCLDIERYMMTSTSKCMVQSGFCSLERKDEFYIERGFNLKGFPTIFPKDYTTLPLSSKVYIFAICLTLD